MAFKVPSQYRLRSGPLGSSDDAGNNGAFLLSIGSQTVKTMASDGMGWEHVSVSLFGVKAAGRTPSWAVMCAVKDLFWDEEDVVLQFHPKKSEYINNHAGCLHLWRPIGVEILTPTSIMVGLR